LPSALTGAAAAAAVAVVVAAAVAAAAVVVADDADDESGLVWLLAKRLSLGDLTTLAGVASARLEVANVDAARHSERDRAAQRERRAARRCRHCLNIVGGRRRGHSVAADRLCDKRREWRREIEAQCDTRHLRAELLLVERVVGDKVVNALGGRQQMQSGGEQRLVAKNGARRRVRLDVDAADRRAVRCATTPRSTSSVSGLASGRAALSQSISSMSARVSSSACTTTASPSNSVCTDAGDTTHATPLGRCSKRTATLARTRLAGARQLPLHLGVERLEVGGVLDVAEAGARNRLRHVVAQAGANIKHECARSWRHLAHGVEHVDRVRNDAVGDEHHLLVAVGAHAVGLLHRLEHEIHVALAVVDRQCVDESCAPSTTLSLVASTLSANKHAALAPNDTTLK
jgi:hypothetical protein